MTRLAILLATALALSACIVAPGPHWHDHGGWGRGAYGRGWR